LHRIELGGDHFFISAESETNGGTGGVGCLWFNVVNFRGFTFVLFFNMQPWPAPQSISAVQLTAVSKASSSLVSAMS
jgi:hypothetical protein